MVIENWIQQMQRFVKDFPILTRETWDGDGTMLAFRTNNKPVLESSYTVKVGGVIRTEDTHYTIDLDTGLLTFVAGEAPAAGNDNVSIDYKYAKIRDEDWIEIYNNIVRKIRDDLYQEANDTSLVTVAKQYEYDLDAISKNIISILEVFYRTNDANPWTEVGQTNRNAKFLPELNELQFRPYFDTTGYEIKFHYLFGFDTVSAITDDVDIPDKWLNVFKFYGAAEYLNRIIPSKLTETAVVTKEKTYHPADTVAKLSDYFDSKGDKELKKVRPPKRPKYISLKADE